jgi:hypothetical protein
MFIMQVNKIGFLVPHICYYEKYQDKSPANKKI